MKSITRLIALAVAVTTLSGCASAYNGFAKRWNSVSCVGDCSNVNLPLIGDNTKTTPVGCKDGKSVYATNWDEKFQVKIGFTPEGVLVGENIAGGGNYYMHQDVAMLIEQTKSSLTGKPITKIYLLDDTKTIDGLTYKQLAGANKLYFDRICGTEKMSEIATQNTRNNISAAKNLVFEPVTDKRWKGTVIQPYTVFPGFKAILKKHVPGFTDTDIAVSDPVAVLTHFATHKDKLTAFDTELEAYFTGAGYQTDIADSKKAGQQNEPLTAKEQAEMQKKNEQLKKESDEVVAENEKRLEFERKLNEVNRDVPKKKSKKQKIGE